MSAAPTFQIVGSRDGVTVYYDLKIEGWREDMFLASEFTTVEEARGIIALHELNARVVEWK